MWPFKTPTPTPKVEQKGKKMEITYTLTPKDLQAAVEDYIEKNTDWLGETLKFTFITEYKDDETVAIKEVQATYTNPAT